MSTTQTVVQRENRLDKYDGVNKDIRVQTWIRLYEVYTHGKTNDEPICLLLFNLKGLALEWFGDEIAGQTYTWQQIEDRMEERFGFTTATPLLDAQNRRLSRDEKVEDYYRNKMRLLRQTGLNSTEQVQQLTNGLPRHCQLTIISSGPKTPSQWVPIAQQTEQHYNSFQSKFKPKPKPFNKTASTHSAPVRSLPISSHQNGSNNAQIHNRPRFNGNQQYSDQNPPQCLICQRRNITANHWHRQCPFNTNPSYSNRSVQARSTPNALQANTQLAIQAPATAPRSEQQSVSNPSQQTSMFSIKSAPVPRPRTIRPNVNNTINPFSVQLNEIISNTSPFPKTPLENHESLVTDIIDLTCPVYRFEDVPVSLADITVNAFIDSGSDVSFINYETFLRLNLPLDKSQVLINQVSGQTTSIGRTNVTMTIADTSYVVTVNILKDFRFPLLIGRDIGKLFKLVIDLSDMTVSIKSRTIPSVNAFALATDQKSELRKVLRRNASVFSKDGSIGRIKTVKHTIRTVDHHPIQLRPYRRPQHEYDEIKRQVDNLLSKGLVRESKSPYAVPALLVRKKDETFRLVIDYRPINSVTIDDKMPLPNINEVFDRLSGARFFTTLDIAWGYWHVEMDPDSIEKTAFVTNEGHYEWLVMPFGLKNALATFQRIIQQILGQYLYKGAINYLDDIIIYSKTFDEHMKLLNGILSVLNEYGIKLKLPKCSFATESVQYLGHVISHNSVHPSPDKIDAIQRFPRPLSLRQLRRFLELAQYYRRFIRDFSRIARPLTDLTCKNTPFLWTESVQLAFQTIIDQLCKEPVLKLYDPQQPVTIYTDASKQGIGAILTQLDSDNSERVIEYYSQRLRPSQSNYNATELECYAVIEALEHFEPYFSKPFLVYTDHAALQWLLSNKKPKSRHLKWQLKISTYPVKIQHRSGKSVQHVDALSRAFPIETSVLHLTTSELISAQRNDDVSFIRKPIISNGIVSVKHRGFTRAYVPESLRSKLLNMFHEQFSHPGKNKTIQIITANYWWPSIKTDIEHHVQSCKTCQLVKYPNRPEYGFYSKPPSELEPLERIGLDTIVLGPAAKNTKHKYIQVFIDHFSPYIWAFPSVTNKSETIVSLLSNVRKAGIQVKSLLSDAHHSFTSRAMITYAKHNNIKRIISTPYHPQTNGIVERANGTIITKLRAALLDFPRRKWSTLLKQIIDDYNNTPHDATGFTPNILLYGRSNSPDFLTNPIDLETARSLARDRTRHFQLKRKQTNDLKHHPLQLEPGDRVLRRIPDNHPLLQKTSPRFTGPFYVIKRIIDNTYDIVPSLSDDPVRAHVSQLKLFVSREQPVSAEENEANASISNVICD